MKAKEKETVKDVMVMLENIACGGVGKDGATIAELDKCAEEGHSYEDEADLHTAQWCWRKLETLIQ